jgi:hypothetical protein
LACAWLAAAAGVVEISAAPAAMTQAPKAIASRAMVLVFKVVCLLSGPHFWLCGESPAI